MGELMLGRPLFCGESGVDQLVEIIKVLGTPSRVQIQAMNPNFVDHKFPQIQPHSWSKVFPKADDTSLDLIAQLLEYNPGVRLSAVRTMVHPFFNELRDPKMTLPDVQHGSSRTKTLPSLFDFSKHGKFRTLYIETSSRESRLIF